jgi:hypothetical protein
MKLYSHTISLGIAAAVLIAVAVACGSTPSQAAPAASNTSVPQIEASPTGAQPDAKPTDAQAGAADNSGAAAKIESYKLLQLNPLNPPTMSNILMCS